jgi:hypothetical protein
MPIRTRVTCPCCGYLTLNSRANYEICELCNWEDDGQDNENADEVWGGPNSDYSLAEARANFLKYRIMYAPGRDQRITAGDSQLEYETKGELMAALNGLHSCAPTERQEREREVIRLEAILTAETSRKVGEYEAKHRDA